MNMCIPFQKQCYHIWGMATYVCTCLCLCVHTFVHVCVRLSGACMCKYVCAFVCVLLVCLCVHVCICVCVVCADKIVICGVFHAMCCAQDGQTMYHIVAATYNAKDIAEELLHLDCPLDTPDEDVRCKRDCHTHVHVPFRATHPYTWPIGETIKQLQLPC